jgi:hypothetical protein
VIVDWHHYAREDWQRLELVDAVSVARAVYAWAETFTGLVEATEGGGVFRLYVGSAHVVRFLIDHTTDTMSVIQVLGPKARPRRH